LIIPQSAANFCNVNGNGNPNNNNASNVYGCAPDSVRHARCRLFTADVSDTEGKSFLPPPKGGVTGTLTRPGGRCLHGGSRVRVCPFMPVGAMRLWFHAPPAQKSGSRAGCFFL
jgi:hypothetical protein